MNLGLDKKMGYKVSARPLRPPADRTEIPEAPGAARVPAFFKRGSRGGAEAIVMVNFTRPRRKGL